MPTVVLLGTLDTKGREYAFVAERLIRAGTDVVVVDVGVLGHHSWSADVSAEEVAAAAGEELARLQQAHEGADARAAALATMQRGAARIVARLRAEGRCDGILGLGGSGGTAVITAVMRTLPFGVPKVMVSTMASGDIGPYVGSSDICMMHSVTDIAGLNRISIPILTNAAAAMAGMVLAEPSEEFRADRQAIGVTMLGVTTVGALRIVEGLENAGFDAIVFHAVGSGGRALEELVEQGVITGVIDFTIKEITDDVHGGVFNAGNRRLLGATEKGVPQVIVPGAIEVLNFGALDTVPERFRTADRPLVEHNPQVTAVRLTVDELKMVANELAARLNRAVGRIHIVIPTKGFDSYATPGGPFADQAADHVFIEQLESRLRLDIPVTRIPAHINDARFADAVMETFLGLVN
jgi:uncharacterized protein (UPF0261 family)